MPQAVSKIWKTTFKFFFVFILIAYLIPIALRFGLFLFEQHVPTLEKYDQELPDMASSGILPDPITSRAARVGVLVAPLSGEKGKFLTHSWLVLKRENETNWRRYEVLGFAARDETGRWNPRWFGNKPTLNRYPPDGNWYGKRPVLIANLEGAEAAAIIPKIEQAIDKYEATVGSYRTWPGPNSNTFLAYVLRIAPELQATLPPLAIGKDFKSGIFFGLADSRTGIELNIYGVLGLKVGWIEGLEVNLLGLIAGLDVRRPALKAPLFGRINLPFESGKGREARREFRDEQMRLPMSVFRNPPPLPSDSLDS
jgi:hypothetical protein